MGPTLPHNIFHKLVMTGWPRRATSRPYYAETLTPRHLAMSSTGHPSPLSSSSFAADPLPPLPEIQFEQTRQRIFTHSSGLPRCHKHAFQAPEDDPPIDNEE
jgi:hypothetical protein